MRNKFLLVLALVCFCSVKSYSQLFYKNELPEIDGVEISYRFARASFFNKNSPQTLRFKLKNTNDYDVKVNLELVYYLEVTNRFNSGEMEFCIPAGRARTGKWHGLYFEVVVDDVKDFEKDENWWELETFEVTKTSSCR